MQNTCSTDTAIAASGAGASSSREYKSLPLAAHFHEQFEVSATNLCCASSKSWTPPEIDGSSSGERARCSVQPPVEICQDLSMCSSLPNRLSSWLLELTNIIQISSNTLLSYLSYYMLLPGSGIVRCAARTWGLDCTRCVLDQPRGSVFKGSSLKKKPQWQTATVSSSVPGVPYVPQYLNPFLINSCSWCHREGRNHEKPYNSVGITLFVLFRVLRPLRVVCEGIIATFQVSGLQTT